MNKIPKDNLGSKVSRWQNNFMERHPGFFYIILEFVAELMVACVLATFAFHMLPPELNCMVSKTAPNSSVLSITNEGFLYASGEYGIRAKKPLTKDPEVLSGKQYVDSLERRSKNNFRLQLSGLPYKKQIKIQFKTDHITVDEE